jgi:class 3 adenylate cyclase
LKAALGIACALAVGLAIALLRSRREAGRLRLRVEDATQNLEHLQRSFSHFAPDDVVEEVIARGASTHGERREVTVLFADLVGFTTLSDTVDPTTLVTILNGYFERMSRVITENRGRVSAFIGDGILALFGSNEPNPWQADDGARAALAMRDVQREYSRELQARCLPPLSVGVGLHRGPCVAGIVGSHELMQFTVIGRTINIAARVEGLTRNHDADILITGDVRKKLAPYFRVRELPAVQVRGIEEPVALFALDGEENAGG